MITHFWDVWRTEYLTSLRESQKLLRGKNEAKIIVDDIVIVYDKKQPRHLWKLGRVIELIKGCDDVLEARN